MKRINLKTPRQVTRSLAIDARQVDEERRRASISFSSEDPIQDFLFRPPMALLHEPRAADLRWFRTAGSILVNHDPNQIAGRPVEASIGEDRKGRATIEFDQDAEGERAFGKVKSKSLRGISVGFTVDRIQRVGEDETWRSPGGQEFRGPVDVAVRWEVIEVSLTPIPADRSVGVGRHRKGERSMQITPRVRALLEKRGLKKGAPEEEAQEFLRELLGSDDGPEVLAELESQIDTGSGRSEGEGESSSNSGTGQRPAARSQGDGGQAEPPAPPPVRFQGQPAPAGDPPADPAEALRSERQRISALRRLAREHRVDDSTVDQWIDQGTEVSAARQSILEAFMRQNPQIVPGSSQVEVGTEDREKFQRAHQDALLRRLKRAQPLLRSIEIDERSGSDIPGDIGFVALAVRCLRHARVAGVENMSRMQLFARAIQHGGSDFPAILENVMNKTLSMGFQETRATYPLWTGRAELPDFKPASRVKMSEARPFKETLDLEPIDESTVYDAKETWQLKTYTSRFGIGRQAFINDDLSAFSRIPALFGAAMRRTVQKLVSDELSGARVMTEDSETLFSASHTSGSNLATPGGAPTIDTVSAGRQAMRTQKGLQSVDADKAILDLVPRWILAPSGLEKALSQLLSGDMLANVFTNVVPPTLASLTPIIDPYLDASDANAWYLAADPAEVDTIVVGTLPGQTEEPQTIRVEGQDILGLEWIAFSDVAVQALEHRGLYKNEGGA